MTSRFLVIAELLSLLLAVSVSAGCQQKMARQPSVKPLDASPFFRDGQSARPLVPGTVARGHLRIDTGLFGQPEQPLHDWSRVAAIVGAGNSGALTTATIAISPMEDYGDRFPFPITRAVLQHGHDRYMIYCVVCHDPLGTGRGMIVERGYSTPPSLHIERLRQVPVGHLFAVITHGYGSMPSYAAQVPPRDRWAIAAYIRALQLSQRFPEKDLTERMRDEWDRSKRQAPNKGAGT